MEQVSAARDWLRRHGVDLREGPGAGHGVGAEADVAVHGGPEEGPPPVSRPSFDRFGRRTRQSRVEDEVGDEDAGAGTRVGRPDPHADPEEVARGIVLRKLAVQARTRAELERALKGREVPEEVAAAVLDRMGEVGLVDDVAFAQDWVSSRQQRRHLSRTALRRELQTKGVDRDVIDDALADVAGADEHRAALDLARRRAATMTPLTHEVAYRRLGGVLARRGFSASITARVLTEVLGRSSDA